MPDSDELNLNFTWIPIKIKALCGILIQRKTKINVDSSAVHESKKTNTIIEPVNKNVNQNEDATINKVNENQKPEYVQHQEKTKTDVDSSIVHESKKSGNTIDPVNKGENQKENTNLRLLKLFIGNIKF